jgi:hypothetical protein
MQAATRFRLYMISVAQSMSEFISLGITCLYRHHVLRMHLDNLDRSVAGRDGRRSRRAAADIVPLCNKKSGHERP